MTEKLCSFEGCEKPRYRKQPLCRGHYDQRRRGEELRPLRKRVSKAEAELLRAQGLKKCSDCYQVKPLEEFYKSRIRKDGRDCRCKECKAGYHRQWRETNRERILEYDRQYHEANREQRLEYSRQWYEANRERILEYSRQHYESNREKYRERTRQWKQKNPDKVRASKALRRARKRQAATEPFTVEDVKRIWGENPVCVYCQERPAEHWDHFVPLALGGEHSLANATWPACAPCNLRKQDKHPWEWMLELMTEEEQAAFIAALEARMNKEIA